MVSKNRSHRGAIRGAVQTLRDIDLPIEAVPPYPEVIHPRTGPRALPDQGLAVPRHLLLVRIVITEVLPNLLREVIPGVHHLLPDINLPRVAGFPHREAILRQAGALPGLALAVRLPPAPLLVLVKKYENKNRIQNYFSSLLLVPSMV